MNHYGDATTEDMREANKKVVRPPFRSTQRIAGIPKPLKEWLLR
jgi:hypothetical protein